MTASPGGVPGPDSSHEIPPGTFRYFENWIGYVPPYAPQGPIEYVVAEASRACVVFTFDGQGRAVSFEKWLATAAQADPSSLSGRTLPTGKLFLAADPADGSPGRVVSLEDTQGLDTYYRAHLHPDATVALLERVRRERTIRHEYRYWEDGQLREWRFDSAGERGVREFDRHGYQVSSATETRG